MQSLLMSVVVIGAAVLGSTVTGAVESPVSRAAEYRMAQGTGGPDSLCVANGMQGKHDTKIPIRGSRIARSGSGGSGMYVSQGTTICAGKARYVTGYDIMVGEHAVPYNFAINVASTAPYISIGYPGDRNASVTTSPDACLSASAPHQAKCTVTFTNIPTPKK